MSTGTGTCNSLVRWPYNMVSRLLKIWTKGVSTFAFHSPRVTVLPAQFLTSWENKAGSGLS